MSSPTRRLFLGASLASLAAPPLLHAAAPPTPDDPTSRPGTLFLTWQRDPTTTMTIQWVGTAGKAGETTISYAVAKSATWQSKTPEVKPYPKTNLKVHRTELTDLKPGTDYSFRIGKVPNLYRFRTMPAKATDTIHFISGGDCGVNAHAVANNIQAAKQDPMFAVVGGDLGYDNGRSVDISLGFIRNYSKHMLGRDGRLIPLIPCIGNHEVDGGYGKKRDKAPFFYALFGGLFRDTGYTTLDFGEYLSLILLDTNHTSPIGGAQASWLDKALKARKDHPNVFVVNHVPAYPSYRAMEGKDGKGGTGADNRKHWVPLFEKYRVPVVLEHHDHTFKRSRPLIDGTHNADGVLYLGDGSWGKLRKSKAPEKLPHLAKTSDEYHLTLHRVEGEERFHLALGETGRVMDVCRTGQRKSESGK